MKHYGIWFPDIRKWMKFSDGRIFWTTSKDVASIQLAETPDGMPPYQKGAEVREFNSDDEQDERKFAPR